MKQLKAKLTGIKIKEGENIKHRLKETRVAVRIPHTMVEGIPSSVVRAIEEREGDIRIGTLARYLKAIGIRKITFSFNDGEINTTVPFNKIADEFKFLRKRERFTQKDVTNVKRGNITSLESGKNSNLQFYLDYAKFLKINELTIIL